MTTTDFSLGIFCDCDEFESFDFYQVIVFNANDSSGKIYSLISNCSTTTTVYVELNGIYHIEFFDINDKNGIIGSKMYYAGNITVNGTTNPTSSTTAVINSFSLGKNAFLLVFH